MQGQDWYLTGDGNVQAVAKVRAWDLLRDNYRLYRFLTELEDILNQVEEESLFLPKIQKLVRSLLVNSYWVQSQCLEPDPTTGTAVLQLYDELGFPLTVQTVTFAPGTKSNIHNHGTWGVVAVLKGQEKNTFWQRVKHPELPDKIECTGELNLVPGDIISFTQDAIHCVEAMGDEPTVTFNVYGETDPKQRFEFDVVKHLAKRF
ncbi:cupin 2, conserved barrel domain protein [Richelia sinica FACHB-800]|uniref:Cupin 2, conserved barrel domain protein n=1 Tax=Richelia sinica FACHB-800 TaxID=1357546 RepID=A0A975Y327_9NOST|nr:cupin [Richelia sinica]MBD2665871.1 cupin [Richelia sinica FACHB-800]QXE21642.1 cupin 2, conserved barrel domain protein [Richelia sinica FACHB-800]